MDTCGGTEALIAYSTDSAQNMPSILQKLGAVVAALPAGPPSTVDASTLYALLMTVIPLFCIRSVMAGDSLEYSVSTSCFRRGAPCCSRCIPSPKAECAHMTTDAMGWESPRAYSSDSCASGAPIAVVCAGQSVPEHALTKGRQSASMKCNHAAPHEVTFLQQLKACTAGMHDVNDLAREHLI